MQFHFLIGQAIGLVLPQVQRLIRRYLSDKAIVYGHQAYADYMRVIANCDMFLNPFPFGNTNGIVDTVFAGLVGVCKTGPEVHEHIDEGMFGRLDFPRWLVADTVDKYVEAALILIDDAGERKTLAQNLAGPAAINKVIFAGRAEILGDKIEALWKSRLSQHAAPAAAKTGSLGTVMEV
ncbi:hypothetical protein [Cupriavidus sp. D39]|uniref:hypothetical protein n=1 Tax=Cupriavidus sp. D39 TaxID=2997877 RepID=UPI002D1E38B6|nr:hypothetical protein [Cupriavidus sp. D39]